VGSSKGGSAAGSLDRLGFNDGDQSIICLFQTDQKATRLNSPLFSTFGQFGQSVGFEKGVLNLKKRLGLLGFMLSATALETLQSSLCSNKLK
jgi:hypothetical protein